MKILKSGKKIAVSLNKHLGYVILKLSVIYFILTYWVLSESSTLSGGE